MMSLLPFLRCVKAATDGDKDDREKSSRVPSKPLCEIRFVTWFAEAGLPWLHPCIDSYMVAMCAQWNHNKIMAFYGYYS